MSTRGEDQGHTVWSLCCSQWSESPACTLPVCVNRHLASSICCADPAFNKRCHSCSLPIGKKKQSRTARKMMRKKSYINHVLVPFHSATPAVHPVLHNELHGNLKLCNLAKLHCGFTPSRKRDFTSHSRAACEGYRIRKRMHPMNIQNRMDKPLLRHS
ncbi:hypothetical protein Patl1_21350 [Pistacia atlantica]|uniref:Uncharacterized protein n=1 Tax=Pistacia atlantica TaxID=434234 RepID=A0ACC1BNK4_9ROSI|nr:hypothetical protein Patl1_21350 [Pistacia atlantica]